MTSAVELARSVRTGDRTARSVIEAHLAVIDARDAELHAFLHVQRDSALAAADHIDEVVASGKDPGALAGVPVALKDNLCTRGVPTTAGSRILEGWVPPYSATVVERLAAAGAIVIGKTNLDEFAMGSSTENSAFGPTHNPHDTTRVPGGSSGGSAVAVASGMAALGLGSDTGGSIRQPAALCGVVGVKPTYGMVSRYGLIAFASSLDQIGPLASTVEDAAVCLDVISGHDPRDSTSLPEAAPSMTAELDRGVEGRRIGLVRELVEGADPEVARAVEAAAAVLESAGATLVELELPELRLGLSAYYLIAPAEASSNLARYDGVRYGLRVDDDSDDCTAMMVKTRTKGFGDEVKRRIMLGTYALSAGYYDAYYGRAQRVRTLLSRAFAAAYERADLLLGATTPTTAFALGEKTQDPMSMYLSDVFTIPSDLSGEAAASIPFATGADGLPIGVQLLGPARSEPQLLGAARVLEASRSA